MCQIFRFQLRNNIVLRNFVKESKLENPSGKILPSKLDYKNTKQHYEQLKIL
jgi:hypothetical protein